MRTKRLHGVYKMENSKAMLLRQGLRQAGAVAVMTAEKTLMSKKNHAQLSNTILFLL